LWRPISLPNRFNPRRWGFFISGGASTILSRESALCFNPRRWGFFISGMVHGNCYWEVTSVSIPVDGAFLFQVRSLPNFRSVPKGFNPRRWGFFISGLGLLAALLIGVIRFNPRRWGFFISGLLPIEGTESQMGDVSIPVDGAFLFQVGCQCYRV